MEYRSRWLFHVLWKEEKALVVSPTSSSFLLSLEAGGMFYTSFQFETKIVGDFNRTPNSADYFEGLDQNSRIALSQEVEGKIWVRNLLALDTFTEYASG